MTYILTLWLIWAPADSVLVRYEAPSCSIALDEVLAAVIGDGVMGYRVVDCQRVLEA